MWVTPNHSCRERLLQRALTIILGEFFHFILTLPERHHGSHDHFLTSCIDGSVNVWQPPTTAKEFPRSVENQLLQLYHPTHYLQDRQDSGLLAECPSSSVQQRSIRRLICHCMSRRTTSWLETFQELWHWTMQQKLRHSIWQGALKDPKIPTVKAEDRSKWAGVGICANFVHKAWLYIRKNMVQCDGCDRWYHMKCVGMRRAPISDWHCNRP